MKEQLSQTIQEPISQPEEKLQETSKKNSTKKPKQLPNSILVIIALVAGIIGGYIGGAANLSTQPQKEPQKIIQSQTAFSNVAEQAKPAVVSIIANKELPKIQQFRLGPITIPKANGTEKQQIGGGTGFIIESDGLIITNKHVITDEKAEYTVLTNDKKEYSAKILAKDPVNDIAILKIEATDLPTLKLGSTEELKVGEYAIAIGNALGQFQNTVSVGVISGVGRSIQASNGNPLQAQKLYNIIQTDTAINKGNSGGPLLNINGEVIGMNTAVAQQAQGIGFALPIEDIVNDIKQVKETGKITTPHLGVRHVILNKQVAEKLKLEVTQGAYLLEGVNEGEPAIVPGSAAEKAGLQEKDIITKINDTTITEDITLTELIRKQDPMQPITITYIREGKEQTTETTLTNKE